MLTTAHGERLLGTAECARRVGVTPAAIRHWRKRPLDPAAPDGPRMLQPDGLDERGYPLHTEKSLREAEREVRRQAIERCGVDPRDLRGPRAKAKAGVAA
jgi:hypothetical protein